MKKEALVFLLFVSLIFVIGAGCSKQDAEVKSFADWSESLPIYYSLFNAEYSTQINSAVYNDDVIKCEEIIDEERSRESILSFVDCKHLLIKMGAFKQKDYEICNELYDENDQKEYEECIAPIVAYSAVSLNDENYCESYLSVERLIELCEDDYETYA